MPHLITYIADIRASVVTGSIVHHLSEKSDKIHDFKSNLVSDIFLSDKLGLRVFSLLKVFQIVFISVYESAAEILQNSIRTPCRLVLDVSSICCWQKGERMTLKLSLQQTHWQISATKPNFKEAVLGLILNLISRIIFYP